MEALRFWGWPAEEGAQKPSSTGSTSDSDGDQSPHGKTGMGGWGEKGGGGHKSIKVTLTGSYATGTAGGHKSDRSTAQAGAVVRQGPPII